MFETPCGKSRRTNTWVCCFVAIVISTDFGLGVSSTPAYAGSFFVNMGPVFTGQVQAKVKKAVEALKALETPVAEAWKKAGGE